MDDLVYQKVWNYIKEMRYFSVIEIQVLLALDNNNKYNYKDIEGYLDNLHKYGIIEQHCSDNFILKKDIGQLAPKVLQEYLIYNPNSGKILPYSIIAYNPNFNNSVTLGHGDKK